MTDETVEPPDADSVALESVSAEVDARVVVDDVVDMGADVGADVGAGEVVCTGVCTEVDVGVGDCGAGVIRTGGATICGRSWGAS